MAKLPSEHCVQVEAPIKLYFPDGHNAQADPPVEYVPAGQLEQELENGFADFPAGHCEQVSPPSGGT